MMKTTIFLLILCSSIAFSQDTVRDGASLWIGTLSGNKKNGVWTEYRTDTLKSRGSFRNDVKNGTWEYYGISFEENVVIGRGPYLDGVKHGRWNYSAGYQRWEGRYARGRKEGIWRYYDLEMGEHLVAQGSFVKSIAEGPWKTLDEGRIMASGAMSRGQLSGAWRLYHPGGSIAVIGTLAIDPDTIVVDPDSGVSDYSFWRVCDELYRIRQNCDGLYRTHDKTGEWRFFHGDSVLAIVGNFERGKKEGEWRHYHGNGALQRRGNYVNGKKTGEWREYHDSGGLKSVEQYVGGLLEGACSYYAGGGWLLASGQYAAGNRCGEWKRYIENGTVVEKGSYDGLPDHAMTPNCDYGETKPAIELMFNRPLNPLPPKNKIGDWTDYFANGAVRTIIGYAHDKLSGRYESYAETGHLTYMAHYENDSLHGETVSFNWNWAYVWRHGVYKNGKKISMTEYEKGKGPTKEEYFRKRGYSAIPK